jgi:hypothetical protein
MARTRKDTADMRNIYQTVTTLRRHCPYHEHVEQSPPHNSSLSIVALHTCRKTESVRKWPAPCHYDREILVEDKPVVGAEKDNSGATNHW